MKNSNFFAISVRGASHISSGLPMQDYSLARKEKEYCVAVVCDGHGSEKHFRSQIGSRLACEVTLSKLGEIAEAYPLWDGIKDNIKDVLFRLKLSILSEWHSALKEYTDKNPVTEEELKKASNSFKRNKQYNVSQPYGTTLLAALVAEDYYICIMLGDGAILKLLPDQTGEIVQFDGKPVYDDGPHSLTDSLCNSDAAKRFYFTYAPLKPGEEGIAFGLCSDGMSEAFVSDSYIKKFMINYLAYYAENGENAIEPITQQLSELSAMSPLKDDVSLAYATNHVEMYKAPAAEGNTGAAEQK